MPSVNVPGLGVVNFPDGTPETEMTSALEKLVGEKSIDRKAGAPVGVREAVGNAPVQDRLTTIRRYYPDAVPYEDDNFVYRDPQSGKLTLYNEENPRLLGVPLPTAGDVASVGREVAVGVGGTLGGMAGATGAIPSLGTASPATVPAGVGLGAAGAGAAYDALRGLRGLPDTRGIGERVASPGVDFVANAAGQRLAEAAPGAVRAVITGTRNRLAGADPAQIADDFARVGAAPSAGDVTGNRALQGVEQATSKLPTGASRMQAHTQAKLDAVGRRLEEVASGYGRGRTDAEAGRALQRGADAFADEFRATAGRLYDEVDRFVPPGQRVSYRNIETTLEGQAAEFADTPRLGRLVQNPQVRAYLEAIRGDAREIFIANYRGSAESAAKAFDEGLARGELPYQAMKALRSVIGKKLAEPTLVDDIPRADLKAMYGSLTEDMRAAMPSDEARLAFDRANRYYAAGLGRIETTLAKVAQAKYPEQAYSFAMSGSRDGGSKLWQLRRSMPEDEWGVVASRVIRDMGSATPGAQSAAGDVFSPASFLTEWNKLAPDAKAALFRGTRYAQLAPELDRLARVSGAVKDGAAMANTSGTAGQSVFMQVLTGTSTGALTGYALNGEEGAQTGAAAGLIGPYAAARLMTSPKFVNWLVRGASMGSPGPEGVVSHIARLIPLAEQSDPETRAAVLSYSRALSELVARSASAVLGPLTDPATLLRTP